MGYDGVRTVCNNIFFCNTCVKISGFKNNIIHVQKEDFDAFEALDMDSATVTKAQSHKASKVDNIQDLNILINQIQFV